MTTIIDEQKWQSFISHVANGNSEFIVELIDEYLVQLNDTLQQIEQAIAIEDFAQVRSCAHMLKGSSPSLGGVQLGELFAKLEAAAKLSDLPQLRQYFSKVEIMAIAVREDLQERQHNMVK
ncbi:Hpt domain protein [[Leptolyngbya] sp. PCC 7376]|uniref:Hpt domain-containing protein n=1 Tax=[Leptolyngbya] sp. PCC 7376 TaxID=111781 RepID=UPI00029EFAA8|nr:Hpt domain-containing protein [[Leptolyngbya] sp. PCC 7376]AFY39294.1 Hpt domain protein [[Leptolyngbya] sp. PCC 7376]